MKKKFLLLTMGLFIAISAFTQKEKIISGRVYYTVEKILSPDMILKSQIKFYENETIKEMVLGTILKTKAVVSVLEFRNKKSYYSLSESDLEELKSRNGYGINMSSTLAGSSNKYYIELDTEDKYYMGKNMSFEHELVYFEEPKWNLEKEEKKILGYTSKKAVLVDERKKKTIVWYTQEIPVAFGPKNYFGLPSLILEIEKGNDVFLAKKIEINPKNITIIKPTAKTKTTLKEKLKAFGTLMKEEN
ncbi:GLPGLI family protein [uncultured Polaribacter sp.]|uniref:GLPGLI family protein n=1 Tax=uncultured Polaribacter sp. TaxID=174711 RepID=UPI00262C6F01|nr:GLPGLI family protein [uncultured Polaribacter sp.]